MPHLSNCQDILRRLIAKGDVDAITSAERAVNEYLEATPPGARKSGLRFLREDVMTQRNATTEDRRSFADAVNAFIERKLAE
jgi:hypothetical protein